MCDYSLMMLPNRLAVEGEQLVAHKFKSGTTGLVGLGDFRTWRGERPSFWQRVKNCFLCQTEPGPVVCIPPGSRLFLEDIPNSLRRQFEFQCGEYVTFAQRSAESWQHRDVLAFQNGVVLLLQLLPEGQKVNVLGLSSSEDLQPDPAERELAPLALA